MSIFAHLRTLALLSIVAATPAAFANSIDTVTLAPVGSNTLFTVTGTYLGNTPYTKFSSPNTPYTLSFMLPTTPDPATFDFTLPFDAFPITTAVTVNGVKFSTSEIIFFGASANGGMNICLDAGCVDPNTICDINGCVDLNPPAPNSWAIYGDPVYTGGAGAPTFITSVDGINVVHPDSYIAIAPTPEPSSLALLGTGVFGLGASTLRRLRQQRG